MVQSPWGWVSSSVRLGLKVRADRVLWSEYTNWKKNLLIYIFTVFLSIKIGVLHYTPIFIMGGLLVQYKNTLIMHIKRITCNLWGYIIWFLFCLLLMSIRYYKLPLLEYIQTKMGIYELLCSVGWLMIIILVLSGQMSNNKRSSILSSKVLVKMGDISYAFYLFHFIMLLLFRNILVGHYIIILICSFVSSLCLSIFMTYADKRIRRKLPLGMNWNRHIIAFGQYMEV